MAEGDKDQEKPFHERFGELCFQFADLSAKAHEFVRASGRAVSNNPDYHKLQSQVSEIKSQIEDLAVERVLSTDPANRIKVAMDLVSLRDRSAMARGNHYGKDRDNFAVEVLVRALNEVENSSKTPGSLS